MVSQQVRRIVNSFVVALVSASLLVPPASARDLHIHAHDFRATHVHLIESTPALDFSEEHDRQHRLAGLSDERGFIAIVDEPHDPCSDHMMQPARLVLLLPYQPYSEPLGSANVVVEPVPSSLAVADVADPTTELTFSDPPLDRNGRGGGTSHVIAGILQRSHALLF